MLGVFDFIINNIYNNLFDVITVFSHNKDNLCDLKINGIVII